MKNKDYLLFKILFTILFFTLIQDTKAQTKDSTVTKNKAYFIASFGYTTIIYRDFATSPLFYKGVGFTSGFSWLWNPKKSESLLDFNMIFGAPSARTPESNYYKTSANSLFSSMSLYYHYLYKIKQISNDNFKVSAGGAFISSTNLRRNAMLGNNGIGLENITNLMLSAKAEQDISRKTQKQFHFLFIKKTLNPVKRSLSFQLNAGILNMNYRPGYAYSFEQPTDKKAINLADNYNLSVNGWRFETKLEYTKYRSNGNGHKWSYIWDACNVPGKFEPFQMATHRIQYSIIINRN